MNFEKITTNGFGDKYNYGCSAFLATDQGLYIGTCNPFYGGQLYLLKDNMPKAKTTIKLKKSKSTIYIKNKKKIKATITNAVGKTTYKRSKKKVATVSKNDVVKGKAKYKSKNKRIAKVSKKGKVTAVKRGKTTTIVKANGRTLKYKIKVKRT